MPTYLIRLTITNKLITLHRPEHIRIYRIRPHQIAIYATARGSQEILTSIAIRQQWWWLRYHRRRVIIVRIIHFAFFADS